MSDTREVIGEPSSICLFHGLKSSRFSLKSVFECSMDRQSELALHDGEVTEPARKAERP